MASLDADHDGQISFEEFQAGFQVCMGGPQPHSQVMVSFSDHGMGMRLETVTLHTFYLPHMRAL